MQWMKQFAQSVDDNCLRMEWVGVHWYGGASFNEFQQKMQEFYNLYRGYGPRFYETGLAVARDNALDRGLLLVLVQSVVTSRHQLGFD
jgi:hypothetical protein